MNRRGFLFGSIIGGVAAAVVKAKVEAKEDKPRWLASIPTVTERVRFVCKIIDGRMRELRWDSIKIGDVIWIDEPGGVSQYRVLSGPDDSRQRRITAEWLEPKVIDR